MTRGAIIAALVAAVIVAGSAALWLGGVFGNSPSTPQPELQNAAATPVAAHAGGVSAALTSIVEAGRAAAAKAAASASDAQGPALAAERVADQASSQADKAKAAAKDAKAMADKACKSPSDKLLCADAADGMHYAGGQSCKGAQGCGPEGLGTLTDAKRGWESAGQWKDWNLVLGCDTLNGKPTYCGQQAASGWNGFGISTNENDAAISAEWVRGTGKSPMRLDYPTGSKMRGEMVKYELSGLGIYDRADGRLLSGRWEKGELVSGTMVYTASGTVVSGDFSGGAAKLGTIAYKDGRVFVGRIEDGPAIGEALPAEGAIFSPAGAVIQQGTWKNGRMIAN